MSTYKYKSSTGFRNVSSAAYAINFVIACFGFRNGTYHEILAVLIIMVLSTINLLLTIQQPLKLLVYLETSDKEFVFTFRWRIASDLVSALMLFGMGVPGICMASITIVLLIIARAFALKRPDIFRELFRPHESDPVMEVEDDVSSSYAAETEVDNESSNRV